MGTSPVRDLPHRTSHDCRILSEPTTSYADGSEDRVTQILRSASDLTSLSDELERSAGTWGELYHLAKARHFLLRSYPVTKEMSVLEVGAGCGAITRYLGETGGLVDAIEPVEQRARATRLRTRGLANVEVFVGKVDDVPQEPSYDLITVIGVLEYVADGSADPTPYVEFLKQLRERLRPGGEILIAIENRLGVKYLAGAPEDHSGKPYDGLDGYPSSCRARTFSRAELESLLTRAHLTSRFTHLFPDYKLTRCLFHGDLFREETAIRSLAWRVPVFPSDDRGGTRQKSADERMLWRSLVEDGTGGRFANSFLVSAGRSDRRARWASEDLAAYYTPNRRAMFGAETRIVRVDGAIRFRRKLLGGESESVVSDGLTLRASDSELVRGTDLIDIMAESSPAELKALLAQWREAAGRPEDPAEVGTDLDAIPRNYIVSPDGSWQQIDREWTTEEISRERALDRGLLWLAVDLASRTAPDRWKAGTIGELVSELAELARVPTDPGWLQQAIRTEAALQVQISRVSPTDITWPEEFKAGCEQLDRLMSQPLASGPFGVREHDLTRELQASVDEHHRRLQAFEARPIIRAYRRYQAVRRRLRSAD